uniref:Uncharacterized protein n=1 Tax=Timema douglasi TaxID=61478 RepID=A0A7R8VV49_TIMDO|nr:unnamed protein product [Timema douglasi]
MVALQTASYRSSCRWLVPSRALLPPLSIAETTFSTQQSESGETPDRPELSEAECDIDTLKKLKLGLRSSLWSRPGTNSHQSDYSIAGSFYRHTQETEARPEILPVVATRHQQPPVGLLHRGLTGGPSTDTLKKLKLGLRSSLWSRPGTNSHQSDYSIAV